MNSPHHQPSLRNVKLKCPCATTQANQHNDLAQNCSSVTDVQNATKASQPVSTCHFALTLLRSAELHSSHEACTAVVCNLPRGHMRKAGHTVSMQI